MFECYECGAELDEDDVEFECPYCGETDYDEGFIRCDNCETLYTVGGDMWECPYCANEGVSQMCERELSICPCCGAVMDDECCDECGWPDVNQGWLGEEYG